MQWIILIGDESLNLSLIKAIKHDDVLQSYDVAEIKGRYCVDFGEDHIFYDLSNEIINDYETEELQKIPFQSPNFIIMVYTSEARMRKVLRQSNFLKNIYIDDDHGHILPIEKFVEL